MPLGIVLILYLISFYVHNPWRKKRYRRFALWSLIIFTNPFLANECMNKWEYTPIPLIELDKRYDVGIVLTGIADNQREPMDRVYFNKGADRLFHSFMLYKRGIISKILLTGGSGSLSEVKQMEADNLKKALLEMGVAENNIIVENKSVNTHQSAVNVATILQQRDLSSSLLITSSFHMKRAKGCFVKEGVDTDIFPADFYGSKRKYTPEQWIPNPSALQKWTVVFHEIIGICAYWVMDYL